MTGIDITGQRFGRLVAVELIPKEERTWSNKERAWRCKCDCGNEVVVRQRNLRGARMTQSCGCVRKIEAFLATNGVKGLDREYLEAFSDFDKFLFLHKAIRSTIGIELMSLEEYKDYINYFYNDFQFNAVYDFWKKQERANTFYDWAKPSLDHIIPWSRGGRHNKENLHFLTVFENLAKRDMTMEEWTEFKQTTTTMSDYFIEQILEVM
jgi:hypothetical protein